MQSNFFYCYSPTLKKELRIIGEKDIAHAVHPDTMREYWIFPFTPTLKEYLDKRPKTTHKYVKNMRNPNWN